MNLQKHPNRPFPVSFNGFLYTVTGILLAGAGLFRGEIVSSICGTALVLYSLFGFFCSLAGFFRWKTSLQYLSWTDINHVRLVSDRDTAFFTIVSYNVKYASLPETRYSPPFFLCVPVTGKEVRHEITLPLRGRYTSAECTTVIRDFSDFFRFTVKRPQEVFPESFSVHPVPEKPFTAALTEGQTGILRGKSRYKRSEELYEARPYAPGDDPRKINWKLYAHTGSLMLREGELLPPPSAEYLFLFGTAIKATRAKPDRIKTHFDLLINRAAFMAHFLSVQNRIISIQTTAPDGTASFRTVKPDEPDAYGKIRDALSIVQPGHQAIDETLLNKPQFANAAILYFAMPESGDLPTIQYVSRKNLAVMVGPWIDDPSYTEKQTELADHLAAGGFHVSKI